VALTECKRVSSHINMSRPNEITPADGVRRFPFAFVAQWPAAAEFLR
jgi:hypothetical protein